MFDLNDEASGFSKATSFYEYAKALAILRENFFQHQLSAAAVNDVSKIRKQIDEAISALIKQVQENGGDLERSKSCWWINPVEGEDAYIIDLPNGKKIKIDGILENIEQVK